MVLNYKKLNKETYNKIARSLDKNYEKLGARASDIKRAFGYMQKKNPNVLELGCGTGRDAKEILKRTNRYLGVDISESMLDIARRKVPRGKFKVKDISGFMLPSNLDMVFAFASLFHLNHAELKSIFKKIYHSLNHGGIFYISISQRPKPVYRTYSQTEFGRRYYFFHSPSQIKKLAKMNKFVEVWYDNQPRLISGSNWFTLVFQKN